ncbi:hypothetical protein KQ51_00191 [Candidatus Izimaplasma bacterium HR1]|jgi:hypothetical protein|uniref:hypothetical protein n=1 Tax=Candidatus Izimoplasma sp. HR1 TaxID=1541959 RepID=UPI0004F73349|nr:hypothetical protein KQ51_00191 [Candidatus Izimaplasma bacterium HR1]
MKCKECLKELNEMTLYCDRCGAQVSKDKMKLSFKEIEKYVLPLNIESDYKKDHTAEIKKAYFLSNIRKDFRGFKKRYFDQYIDYVLLRTYYQKNNVLLTTLEFDKYKALALLETFENRRPDPLAFEILKEEYGEDYENKVIPNSITEKIENVYCGNFNLKMLSPGRFFMKTLVTVISSTIKVGIIAGLVAAILYFALPMVLPDTDLLEMANSFSYTWFIVGFILLVLGYFSSKKKREFYPFEDIINSNSEFKKHIKSDMRKRIKTLRFRIRKEGGHKKK